MNRMPYFDQVFKIRPLIFGMAFIVLYIAEVSSTWADINVVDDFGREVVLVKPAVRIISLAPHITENLFSAGAGAHLVGVVEYSDYPDQARQIETVGSHSQFNLEVILSLQPDLVVAWQNASNKEALERLEKFGIPIYYSEPRSFHDILENITKFAKLSETTALMDPSVPTMAAMLDDVTAVYSATSIVDVFYQVWTQPLITLNGQHIISEVLDACGANNLFSNLSIIAPRVSIEAVIDANPDVIIAGMTDRQKPDMSIWEKWEVIKAVRNENYIFVDSDIMHRHTLRMLKAIPSFCIKIDTVRRNAEL